MGSDSESLQQTHSLNWSPGGEGESLGTGALGLATPTGTEAESLSSFVFQGPGSFRCGSDGEGVLVQGLLSAQRRVSRITLTQEGPVGWIRLTDGSYLFSLSGTGMTSYRASFQCFWGPSPRGLVPSENVTLTLHHSFTLTPSFPSYARARIFVRGPGGDQDLLFLEGQMALNTQMVTLGRPLNGWTESEWASLEVWCEIQGWSSGLGRSRSLEWKIQGLGLQAQYSFSLGG
jgi:hypothetical protein